jgi:hypothetical protein
MTKTGVLVLAALMIFAVPATASAIPTLTTKDATDLTVTSATLNGKVPAAATATPYWFEYGTTTAYGAQTAAGSVAPSKSMSSVRASIDGLTPDTTYHFRLVGDLSGSRSNGADLTFVTTAAPSDPTGPTGPTGPSGATGSDGGSLTAPIGDVGPGSPGTQLGSEGSKAPDPVLGESLSAGPASGSISVRVPGTSTFVPLAGGAAIPTGSTVDARHGAVRIVTAVGDAGDTQAATFRGAKFKVVQRTSAGGLTDILLRGGNFAACPAVPGRSRVTAAVTRTRKVRSLWSRDHHGRFRTRGRRSIATVRGTVWVTVDRCDGTVTKVKRGAVSVRDLGRRRTVLVHAHERYLAR